MTNPLARKSGMVRHCKHRHTILTHPKCFDKDGYPLATAAKQLPKVLIMDIETSPLKAYIWQKSVWGGNVTDGQVISEWFVLCWSAKWLFDSEILSDRLTGKEARKEDDKRIVANLWKLLDEADIAIAHNGNSFDFPNMNTRFIVHGMPPPSPYQVIDTRLIAKRQFGFTHNSLNGLAKFFGFPEKLDTDFELWKKCVGGDEKSLRYLEEYNKTDVLTLEDVYMKLRPWIRSHPNLGLYVESDSPVCPNCGSEDITWTDKYYYTQTGKYRTFRCKCGALGRSRASDLGKEVRNNLAIGLSR